MEYIKIKDLFKITKGKKVEQVEERTDSSIRFIQIDDLRNDINLKYCENDKKYVIVNKEDIIIAWDGANAGTIGFGLEGAIGSTLAKLTKDNNEMDTEFCGLFLRSKSAYLREKCTGATIPHIQRESLEELEIPKLPLEIQKKIKNIINKAQELIDKRKEQIEALDELVKSQFIEMFGDPVTNSKGWEKEKLNELGELARGKSKHRPRNAPELLGGPYPLVQTGDIANAGIYLKEYTQTYSEFGLKQSKMWDKGTLCITIAANIAKTSILTFDACFPDSVVAFIPNEKTNNMFIQFWMSFLQKILEDSAPESAQKNINLKILSEQKVIVPPIELQNQFADFVEQVDKLKLEMEKSLNELEDNFNSLMQKAFKGELF
ncbi:restriction endonuclease subunit S [Clostridium disporicum]|uniref:Restriction endonuclease S subunit n=1 Tax=Clostridium disporicum TaxID=84024 RepID=A0A174AE65_9CLOT|nr:restriction endonuclease subunit S [Clostridium disporicum]CUN86961.1 restriction endonuclease S subunit [Clostridium disporicum]